MICRVFRDGAEINLIEIEPEQAARYAELTGTVLEEAVYDDEAQ